MEVGIRVCGGLAVELAGERVESRLPGRQGRALFAYLLAHRDRSVTRAELIDALWPAGAPDSAPGTLKSLVSKLRRAVAPLEVAGRSELRLELPPDARVDVDVADAAVRAAEEALAAGSLERAEEAARTAIAIASATPLPGIEGDWVDELRRGAEALAMRALELAATAALETGGPALARAEDLARDLVTRDPYRETAHLLLMRALRGRGDHAAAALAYEELRRLLREELGVAPSADAQRLHAEILAGAVRRPAPRVSQRLAERPPETLAALLGGPFVGRAAELARLRELIARGGRRLVAITGEAGIGKTRLAAAAALAEQRAGAALLAGRCVAGVPYAPFADALEECLAGADDAELGALAAEGGPELLLVAPALRRRLRGVAEPPAAPDAAVVFEAVAAVVDALLAERRGVLVIDDLHLADGASLALLGHLLRRPGAPLAVLATVTAGHAGERVEEALAGLARARLGEEVGLAGLGDDDVALLAEQLLPGAAPAAAAGELARWTGGNPLLLTETLRAARAAGSADLDALGVPTTVRALAGERVARLSEPARDALLAAAALGPDLAFDVLGAALGWAREALQAALDEAIAAGLVAASATGALRFEHELVRRALRDELPPLRRAALHRAAAEAIERLRGPALEPHLAELARHYAAAAPVGAAPEAFRYARRAGERARAVLAFAEAAEHFAQALELAPAAGAGDAEVAEVELARAAALGRAGALAEARGAFLEAAEHARRLGRPDLLARAALGYGAGRRFGFVERVEERLVELLEESLALLPEHDTRLRPRALVLLASELYYVASPERRERLAEQALELARAGGGDHVLAEVVQGAQWATLGPDDPGRRTDAAAELEALAGRLHTAEWLFGAAHLRLVAALERGDRRGVEEAVRRSRALAASLRQPFYAFLATSHEALVALLAGRFDEGEAIGQRGLAAWPAGAAGPGTVFAGMQLFLSFWARGRLDELREPTRAFADAYAWIPAWRCALAFLAAETGRPREAHALVGELAARGFAAIPRDGNWLLSLLLLAMATGATGDREHAFTLRAALLPHRAQHAVAAGGALTLGPVALGVGVLDGLLGDRDAAVEHLEEAVRMSAGLGDGPLLVPARRELALALERRSGPGERERAAELAADARALAERLGMPLEAHRLAGGPAPAVQPLAAS